MEFVIPSGAKASRNHRKLAAHSAPCPGLTTHRNGQCPVRLREMS